MRKELLLIVWFFISHPVWAQDNPSLESIATAGLQQTISDLKSGNTHDILTNAFQASINDLFGKDKEFSFKSTLYGIDSMIFKGTSDLDIFYKRQKFSRKSEIAVNIGGSDSNLISTYGIGLKFSPIDKKDITFADYSKSGLNKIVDSIASFKKEITKKLEEDLINIYGDKKTDILTDDPDETKVDSIMGAVQSAYTQFGRTNDTAKLHPLMKAQLDYYGKKLLTSLSEAYDSLGIIYSRKPLLTISGNFDYDYQNKLPMLKFEGAFTVGLGNNIRRKPWELEANGGWSLENDSLTEGSDISAQTLSISLGINKILRENKENESTMELKLFAGYEHFLGTLLPDTDAGTLTANTTFRVLVFKQFWIPVTLKYDIENADLFTFISLTANLE